MTRAPERLDRLEDAPVGTRRRREVSDEVLRRMEFAISLVLRIGVLSSVAVLLAGLGLMFAHHPDYARLTGGISYHVLTGPGARFPHTFSELGRALARGEGRGVVVLGLVVLVLTPVLRVAVGVLSFALERDLPMTLVTLFVLGVLLASFFLGGA